MQVASDNVVFVETIDLQIGGDDILQGGSGNNVEMGGYGQNLFYGSLSHDILIGNYGAVSFNSSGTVTSLQRDGVAGGSPDLIGAAQDWLYSGEPTVTPPYVQTGLYSVTGSGDFLDTLDSDAQSGNTAAADSTSSAFYEGGDEGGGQGALLQVPPSPPSDNAPADDGHGVSAPAPQAPEPTQPKTPVPPPSEASVAVPAGLADTGAQLTQGARRSVPAVAAAGVALLGLAAGGKKRDARMWVFDQVGGAWRPAEPLARSRRRLELNVDRFPRPDNEGQPASTGPAWFSAAADECGLGGELTALPAAAVATTAPASRARIQWAPGKPVPSLHDK